MRAALAVLALAAAAYAQTIVDLVEADPQLHLLLDAVKAGGLVETLSGPGPFTVFAPVDEAFYALGPLLPWALSPHNVKDLDNILTYHVVSGKVLSSDLKDGEIVPTLDSNQNLTVHINGAAVTINSSPVIRANVLASNGVVHIIGKSILVPGNSGVPTKNVVELAQSVSILSTLVKAVLIADVQGPLSELSPLTVFAPTDDAFAKLNQTFLAELLRDPRALAEVLFYHVVGGQRVYSEEIPPTALLRSLEGEDVFVQHNGDAVIINGAAKVVQANVDAVNGVVHVIDTVLLPPALAAKYSA